MTDHAHPIPGLDFAALPRFIGCHLPERWSIEVGFAKRCVVIWVQDDTDRDSRIAVEDMGPQYANLLIAGQILAAINHAREQEGMTPITWEDRDRERA